MKREQIIKLIERLAVKYGYTPSTICLYAGCSGHLYKNLLAGKGCMTTSIEKLQAYRGGSK